MQTYRDCLRDLKPYVPGKPISAVKRQYGLSEVVKLASNENPYGCSPRVAEAVAATFKETQVYPDGYCTELRGAISAKFKVEPERILFGAGTDEVIAMLGKVFIEPGDECVTAAVTFPQYASAVESMGGRMVYAPMSSEMKCDMRSLLKYVTPKTKLVFIANPNNPTGHYNTSEEQDALMREMPENVTVVFDEAYSEYVATDDYPNTLETLKKYSNAILLKTFSKVYGLASLRVGYGIMNAETASYAERFRPPFNVSTQAQAAALAAFGDEEFVLMSASENRRVMELAVSKLRKIGAECIPSQANFVAANLGLPSTETFQTLMENGYIVRSGVALGLPDGYQRITIGTERQISGLIETIMNMKYSAFN